MIVGTLLIGYSRLGLKSEFLRTSDSTFTSTSIDPSIKELLFVALWLKSTIKQGSKVISIIARSRLHQKRRPGHWALKIFLQDDLKLYQVKESIVRNWQIFGLLQMPGLLQALGIMRLQCTFEVHFRKFISLFFIMNLKPIGFQSPFHCSWKSRGNHLPEMCLSFTRKIAVPWPSF